MVIKLIKKYRGALWRKLQEKKSEEEIELPGFQISYPRTFIELPTPKHPSEVNVRYPLIIPFANAHIVWDSKADQLQYILEEPKLTEEEKKILERISNALIDLIQVGFGVIKDREKITEYLEKQIKKILKTLDVSLTPDQYIRIMYYIYRNFIGLNEIEPLLRDPWLEDIGCDGVNIPIYIVHRRYGSLKTNVIFKDLEILREFVIKLAERCGRYVSYAEPILDGTLPDGSRVNASLAGDVTTRGPTFTIRKFAERPFSPVQLIELGTVSPDVMAYLWYLVENGASLLISGGVATGKTTFLNGMCMFIPPEAKIVSIEDTRELRIPHEHWIPTVTRLGFGIPMPTGEKYGEITLFDLLKGSFRQNPDYVIVGEVRGKEAYVMFQGISSIPGWEKICLLNDTHFRRVEINKLIPKNNFRIFSIDPKDEKIKILPIKTRVEHRPRKQLFKIKTKTGREVFVTSDHSLFTYTDKIEPIRVDELSIGSKIIIPAKLPSGYNDIEYLNMLELFPDARVFAPQYVKQAVKKLSYQKSSEICGVKSISDYYANFKRSKPSALKVDKFVKLMKEAGIKFNPKNVYVRFSKKSKGYPGEFRLSHQLLRLMGYYIADGSLNESGGNNILLYNSNKQIIRDIKSCLKRVVGFEPKERDSNRGYGHALELSLNHKVLFELLKRYCGKTTTKKKIPEFVFGLNKEKIGHFLAGLYNGDGWVSKVNNKNYVFGYSTQSRDLADDLLFLLLELGIVASVVDRTKESRNRGYEILIRRRRDQYQFLKFVKLLKKDVNLGEILENPKIKNDVYLDEVKEIEKINLERETPVYDISVSGTQNFIGGFGGIMLHNSGHPSLSTFHAGSIDTVIKRLTTPPIELPASLVESLDAVVIMIHAKEKGKSARRIKEIEEIESIDPDTLKVNTFKSVEWDPRTDSYKFLYSESIVLKKIAYNKGIPFKEILEEIERRKAILEWMLREGIKDFESVGKIINEYYKNPEKILARIGKIETELKILEEPKLKEKFEIEPPSEKKEVKKVKPKEIKEVKVEKIEKPKMDEEEIASIFGYKIVYEKPHPS